MTLLEYLNTQLLIVGDIANREFELIQCLERLSAYRELLKGYRIALEKMGYLDALEEVEKTLVFLEAINQEVDAKLEQKLSDFSFTNPHFPVL
jgi:hypothetical protein